jgi:hypothetical protein
MKHNENRIDSHGAKAVCTIAAVHFLLSVVLFVLWGATTMSSFDHGTPPDLTALLVKTAFEILSFPLSTAILLLKIANTGMWGWLGFLANSLLWGWAGWRAIRFWREREVI